MPTTKNIYQLVYCLSYPTSLRAQPVEDSLLQAKSFNEQHNITGCIVFHNNEFYNLFEGENVAIDTLHRFVVNGNLGQNITIVYKQNVANRFFTESLIATDCSANTINSTHLSLTELKAIITNCPGQTSATKVFNQIISQLILEDCS